MARTDRLHEFLLVVCHEIPCAVVALAVVGPAADR